MPPRLVIRARSFAALEIFWTVVGSMGRCPPRLGKSHPPGGRYARQ